jgi:hypothetical protein
MSNTSIPGQSQISRNVLYTQRNEFHPAKSIPRNSLTILHTNSSQTKEAHIIDSTHIDLDPGQSLVKSQSGRAGIFIDVRNQVLIIDNSNLIPSNKT